MSLDRTQKKPHDYRLPPAQRRHQLAFADSDRLTIEGARVSAAIEGGAAVLPEHASPIGRERDAAPRPAASRQLLGVVAVPGACLALGLVLGFVAGTVVTSEPIPVAVHQEGAATATPEAAGEGSPALDAQSTAEGPAAPQAGPRTPAQPEPDETPGR